MSSGRRTQRTRGSSGTKTLAIVTRDRIAATHTDVETATSGVGTFLFLESKATTWCTFGHLNAPRFRLLAHRHEVLTEPFGAMTGLKTFPFLLCLCLSLSLWKQIPVPRQAEKKKPMEQGEPIAVCGREATSSGFVSPGLQPSSEGTASLCLCRLIAERPRGGESWRSSRGDGDHCYTPPTCFASYFKFKTQTQRPIRTNDSILPNGLVHEEIAL